MKTALAGKVDEVQSKILQVEASNLESHSQLNKSIEGTAETILRKIDAKTEELDSKLFEIRARQARIEASNTEIYIELNRNVKGLGNMLMKRIDDKIDQLIERQDRIFDELQKSRDQQNSTVNVFKRDAEDLIFKVNEVSEKIVDFEKNKRNNLILFGIPNDPHETPSTLDGKVTTNIGIKFI